MATKAKAAKAAMSADLIVPDLTLFDFDSKNEPNADVLLNSLRSAGYSLQAAIGDFVDNSIDAEASLVVINLAVDKKTGLWAVEIADNGFGMQEDTLDEMMRLGSRTHTTLCATWALSASDRIPPHPASDRTST